MDVKILDEKRYVKEIVEIHMKTFPGFFLTFLGTGFLNQLYQGFMDHPDSNIIGSITSEGELVGFLAFSNDLSGFYKYLICHKLFLFAWYALMAFFRKPKIFFRLLRALAYPKKNRKKEKYIEISSIGVFPQMKNLGIGSKMIEYLYQISDKEVFDYIKLETDRKGNDNVNHFYEKNGFKLIDFYITPEGRQMNEYRMYLNA